MLKEYIIFDIKVFEFSHLTVSADRDFKVGKVQAKDSVIIWPEALYEKASI